MDTISTIISIVPPSLLFQLVRAFAASKEQKWALLAHSSPLAARAAAAVQSPPVRRRRRLRRFSLPLVQ
jgi:hypothetical protein